MTTAIAPNPAAAETNPVDAAVREPHRRFLACLSDRRAGLSNIGPNWFASVMGTSIVAIAATELPVQVTGQRVFAEVVWALAGMALIAVSAATVGHWRRYPARARQHAADPVMMHFYGAPPMALLAFGAATLTAGNGLIGFGAALGMDWVLWLVGTALGLVSAAAVPYLMFTRHEVPEGGAFGGWLMPVVPPMVSAATGAALIPHTPAGQLRQTLLESCYAMFGISLVASLIVITLLWARLTRFPVGAAAAVPTLWIVLGPLGQSITAANALGAQAPAVLKAPYAGAARAIGVLYGVPVWGFAMMWAAVAIAITVRTARTGLPFSLTWWSFTFPVGTVVTGTSALARNTGSDLFTVAAVVFFLGLLAAWAIVAARTVHDTWTGKLLRA